MWSLQMRPAHTAAVPVCPHCCVRGSAGGSPRLGAHLDTARFWKGSGAAMSSSPWVWLWNGDEDVATPFLMGAVSRCAPRPGMANLGVAGAVAFFRVSVRHGSRSAPSPDAKRRGGSVPELILAPTRHVELRVHLAPQGGRCGLRRLDRIMVWLSSSGSCRVLWLERVHRPQEGLRMGRLPTTIAQDSTWWAHSCDRGL
jgi:hypothetical protein